jgi:two-component system sensor histidine kinase QseC
MRSIRRQLLLLLAAILALTFTISGLLGYLATAEEVQELFDAQLIENARVLKGVMNHSPEHVDWEHMRASLEETRDEEVGDNDAMADGHAYEKKVAIQVWSGDGNLVLRSPSAPEYSLSPLHHGFYTRRRDGYHWHVYTSRMEANGYWLIVAERSDVRDELSLNVAASLFTGALIGLGLALYLMRRGLRRELQPLADLQAAIGEREPEKLTPIALPVPREELQPVVEALNHLLARVNEGMERERRFLADAAHELRTPLAVLRLKAQSALGADSLEAARPHLERLIGGVDRSTRVVEQLLLLARLDADAIPQVQEPVVLDAVARETLASLAPLAHARRQELVLDTGEGDFTLQGNGALLGALLRNLVENGMRHSPEGSAIRVQLAATPTSVQLAVRDAGTGVDPALLGTLTRRFVRAHQADTQGTGLGLAIVAHITELHRGTLVLANLTPSGLEVGVTLPRR